jgi:hypothetical protein
MAAIHAAACREELAAHLEAVERFQELQGSPGAPAALEQVVQTALAFATVYRAAEERARRKEGKRTWPSGATTATEADASGSS